MVEGREGAGAVGAPGGPPAAGLVRRLVAYWLDCSLIYAIVMPAQFVLYPAIMGTADGAPAPVSGLLLELYVLATISLPAWCYFAWFDRGPQWTTVGKRLLGLRTLVVRGAGFGFGRGLARTAVKLLPWETAHLVLNLPQNPFLDPATGEFLGWETGEWRWGYVTPYVLLLVWLVVLLRDPLRRSVHDFVAGTRVVRR
ncbi:MAG: RDD family protein [bacterium]|nr:RDD family protein [bacterium]